MTAAALAPLDAALLVAHAAGDGRRLAVLYGEAADTLAADGELEAACFYWTQALVFALEAGMQDAERHAATLRGLGRL